MLVVKQLGLQPFEDVWQEMRSFTDQRTEQTADELWLLQHPAVFTLGQAGKEQQSVCCCVITLSPGSPLLTCKFRWK